MSIVLTVLKTVPLVVFNFWVFFFADLQRLQNEKQNLKESNAPAGENMHSFLNLTFFVCDVGPKLPYAFHFVASDDSGSLQEQVKQVGIMLKMFAHTGQSGTTCKQLKRWLLV